MTIKQYPLVRYSRERLGDVILAEFPANLRIDLEVAREIIGDRLDFAKDEKHYVIIDVSNVREITIEAKEFMQRPDPGQKNILGAAFVGTNPISVLFANIFRAPLQLRLQSFHRRVHRCGIGLFLRRRQTFVMFHRKFRVDRQPDRRAVLVTGQFDREFHALIGVIARLHVLGELVRRQHLF